MNSAREGEPGRHAWSSVFWMVFFFVCPFTLAADVLLVVRPKTEGTYSNVSFQQVLQGMEDSLAGDFEIQTHLVDRLMNQDSFIETLHRTKPKLIVLMDTRAINLYKRYQITHPELTFPPAVMVMSLFVEREIKVLKNVIGIEYQIQAVTSLVNLRSLVHRPVKRVGVLYREELDSFFQQQRLLCLQEDIELVGINLKIEPDRIRPRHIRKALKQLIRKHQVDAFWVLNDSVILQSKLLSGWTPLINQDIPVVVGIEKFVSSKNFIGHFAVVPDHYSLGEQTADLIESIHNEQWQIHLHTCQSPISVKKILNRRKMDKALIDALDASFLLELDHIYD